jgi:tRNA threonylcarbamoyladenosine biosynthesis protein TsaB
MNTLCMDTSSTFLVLALIQDGRLLGRVQKNCWKRQSEEIFPVLQEMLGSLRLTPQDMDEVVVTTGPGSYTGVRIAMTIAKVFCAMGDKKLYSLGTLALYAGRQDHVRVLLDARSHRAYTAVYEKGKLIGRMEVLACSEIEKRLLPDEKIVGDGHLVGHLDVWPDLAAHFLEMKDFWQPCPNVHLLKPEYLKSSEAYLTGIR